MNSYYTYCDVHGAGAQRSDPKNGTWYGNLLGVDINGDDVYGYGPQGDVIRVTNYVRLVRDMDCSSSKTWIGPLNDYWNNESHWNPGSIPSYCDDVVIPSGSQVKILSGNTGQGKTLDVELGAELEIPLGAELDIQDP